MEKEAELEAMRSRKREERDYFKKMENGELDQKEEYRPKLLVGKLKDVSKVEGISSFIIYKSSNHKSFSHSTYTYCTIIFIIKGKKLRHTKSIEKIKTYKKY